VLLNPQAGNPMDHLVDPIDLLKDKGEDDKAFPYPDLTLTYLTRDLEEKI
jgi:hypothetical protein